ncbi:TetR/AcrR family transcriptional regulator [Actinocrispum wychmicini]|uniref:TetR family transcriptional regulator n=1 Tax=Actinocrispum wychmicini TaxID=1213861 RepID=A0A4R2JNV3_9PSEU|nr:TetR/AcrR family transcriptional regulator [Actinocrispum wychmicini]TCO61034.1 TetR family transcriptional regulator [Actinocrispum wychmicini]
MFRAKRRGKGPRDAAAIYSATVDLLVLNGYEGLTIEGVAAHSKVNKTTIYRWWPSKDALLAATLEQSHILELTVADTGSLRGDLIGVVDQVVRMLTIEPGGRIARAALGGLDRPGLSFFVRMFCEKRAKQEAPIFERAKQRGELAEDVDPTMVVDLLAGAIWFRLLVRQAPMPDGYTEAIVDAVLTGLRQSS